MYGHQVGTLLLPLLPLLPLLYCEDVVRIKDKTRVIVNDVYHSLQECHLSSFQSAYLSTTSSGVLCVMDEYKKWRDTQPYRLLIQRILFVPTILKNNDSGISGCPSSCIHRLGGKPSLGRLSPIQRPQSAIDCVSAVSSSNSQRSAFLPSSFATFRSR